MLIMQLNWCGEDLSPALSTVMFKSLYDVPGISLPFILWTIPPKSKVQVNVLNLSDKVKNFRFVEGRPMFNGSWDTIGEKNEASICTA
jgi:hypothetical protein